MTLLSFCKYIINLKLDDKYTKYVLDNLILFKFINPNVITLIGLLADFFILYFLINKLLFFLALSLFIRYSADCLDGAVARKFNKTSKLGGYLDTINDIMLISLYTSFLYWNKFNNLKYTKLLFVTLIISLVLYFKKEDLMHDHSNLKSNNYGVIKGTIQFMTNNSIFVFILAIIYNSYYLN